MVHDWNFIAERSPVFSVELGIADCGNVGKLSLNAVEVGFLW